MSTTKIEQVGGTHYQVKEGGLQHWDYCVCTNVPYLEGVASKYLVRWRDKNGVEDLKKAQTYVQKRLAFYRQGYPERGTRKNSFLFQRFAEDNAIPPRETAIIDLIMHWQIESQLCAASHLLDDMITEAEAGPTSAYVDQDR